MNSIMTASKKSTVIVIDPNTEKAEEVRKMMERSMEKEKIAVISAKCLFSRFSEIDGLMGNVSYWKMFYGCDLESFEKIVARFNSKLGEVTHLGWKLNIAEVESCYWKKKGFEVFPPTVSNREGSHGEEL